MQTRSMLRSQGFTLVEILVVVVIIGILLTFATISVGGRTAADTLDTEAQRMEQLFRLAQEEAELKGFEIGFRHTEAYYQFLALSPEGRWAPISDGPLRPRPIQPPLYFALRVEGRPVPPAQDVVGASEQQPLEPQVLVLSSGELTAFTLELGGTGLPLVYRLSGTLIGRLSLERADPDRLP